MQTSKNPHLPERAGKKWDVEEESKLLKMISRGVNRDTIALECQRTIGGISSRLREIACRFINDGKPMKEVVQLTGLVETEIKEALELRQRAERMKIEKTSNGKLNQKLKSALSDQHETSNTEFMTILVEIRDLLKELVQNKDASDK